MKEELVQLKDAALELGSCVKAITGARDSFNKSAELNGVLDEYFDEECVDYYDAAKKYALDNADIITAYETLMEEHPKYGDKRRRATVVDQVLTSRGVDYEENFSSVNEAYDEYVVIRTCGYNEVRALELNLEEASKKINANGSIVVTESKDAVVKAATSVATGVANFAKPYGEVAKGQLHDAGVHARGVVNKSVKSLIKTLQNIEEKTK